MKTTTFSHDFPFEQIADAPALNDPAVRRLADFVGRYPHEASATRHGFQKFRKLLEAVEAPWKGTLITFTENIVGGAYRREFGKTYNRRAGGSCANGECSQTSELFSLFTQAAHYDTCEENAA